MRFSIAQGTLLAIAGLAEAQTCPPTIVGFEDLDLSTIAQFGVGGALQSPISQGYAGLNWTGFFGVTPSPVAQFHLPQGQIFAAAPNSPATNPPSIFANTGRSFDPQSIFMVTYVRNGLTGALALASAGTVTVTAFFADGTSAQTTFKFDLPRNAFGIGLTAVALQNFQFPCGWKNVTALIFRPHSDDGLDSVMGFAIDSFMLIPK